MFGVVLATCVPSTFFSQPSQGTTMASTSGRGGTLSALDAAVQTLSLAKDACVVPPAQIAFSSACTLLAIIKVRCLRFRDDRLPIHVCSGLRIQQTRLCRTRAVLR